MAPWLILSVVAGLIVVLLAVFIYRKSKKSGEKMETDYRTFFAIGAVFFVIGLSSDNIGLWPLGLVFMIVGLANKNKWKPYPKWSELSPAEKKIRISILVGLLIAFILVVVVFFLKK